MITDSSKPAFKHTPQTAFVDRLYTEFGLKSISDVKNLRMQVNADKIAYKFYVSIIKRPLMEAFLSIIKKYNGMIRIYPEDSVICIETTFDVNTINSLYK